jgi:hypothetical protein
MKYSPANRLRIWANTPNPIGRKQIAKITLTRMLLSGRLGPTMPGISTYLPRIRRKFLSSHREGRVFVLKSP